MRGLIMAKSNSDSTIKFLIYILVFLIFVLLLLLIFIIPSIKGYKAKRSDLRTYQSQNKHLSEKQVHLSKAIARYKKENSALLKAFSDDFNQTAFITFAKRYFSDVSLSRGKAKKDKSQFTEYTFKATSQASTPVDFYKFIDALEAYPAIIKINFPITLISSGNKIDVDFNLSIYQQKN